MNQINPKKLLKSKWTAKKPLKAQMELRKKEKHFMVVKVVFDDDGNVTQCLLEALLSRRVFDIDWRELKDAESWGQGWQ